HDPPADCSGTTAPHGNRQFAPPDRMAAHPAPACPISPPACPGQVTATAPRSMLGPTHRKAVENLEEIVGVPAGFEAAGLETEPRGRLVAEQVEGNVAEDDEVLGGRPLAEAAVVLIEDHIAHPMHLMLDPPSGCG